MTNFKPVSFEIVKELRFKKVKDMINRIYDAIGNRCKNGGVFQRKVGYQLRKIFKSRELHERKKLHVELGDKLDFSISEDLGFIAIDGFQQLSYTQEVIDIVKKEFSKLDINSIDWKSKDHLFTGVLDDLLIDSESALVKFSLQAELIRPIINYLGFVPVLSHVGAWYSPGKITTHSSSQLFHCDQADVRQVKVFVHCSDIAVADGALHLINARDSELLRQKLRYKWDDENQCLPDNVILEHFSDKHWVPQVGDEGAVLMCDSSRCFHFGSRLTDRSRDRLVIMFQYLSPCAFTLPSQMKSKLPFSNMDGHQFGITERLILGLDT